MTRPYNSPLRVLHVTSVASSNYFLNNLVTATDPSSIQYFAVTLAAGGGFVSDLQARGVTTFALNGLSRKQYPRVQRELRQIITEHDIDIVNAHLFEPTLLALTAARLQGRKTVVTRHHSDALYRIPSRWKRALYLGLERYINANTDHIIAPSQLVQEILIEREHVPAHKVSLIPYGQTLERFSAVTAEQIARVKRESGMQEGRAIVCVARLHKEKGHLYLLEAFSELYRAGLYAQLFLVGTGPERANLEALAQQLRIGAQVKFLGWRDDALAIIAAADMVVHPSLQEALPSAVIEALMLERPIVATDVSGVRDLLGENERGLVVPPANVPALTQALQTLLNNLDAAQKRAQQGRAFVLETMGAPRVAAQYTACYKSVAQQ